MPWPLPLPTRLSLSLTPVTLAKGPTLSMPRILLSAGRGGRAPGHHHPLRLTLTQGAPFIRNRRYDRITPCRPAPQLQGLVEAAAQQQDAREDGRREDHEGEREGEQRHGERPDVAGGGGGGGGDSGSRTATSSAPVPCALQCDGGGGSGDDGDGVGGDGEEGGWAPASEAPRPRAAQLRKRPRRACQTRLKPAASRVRAKVIWQATFGEKGGKDESSALSEGFAWRGASWKSGWSEAGWRTRGSVGRGGREGTWTWWPRIARCSSLGGSSAKDRRCLDSQHRLVGKSTGLRSEVCARETEGKR